MPAVAVSLKMTWFSCVTPAILVWLLINRFAMVSTCPNHQYSVRQRGRVGSSVGGAYGMEHHQLGDTGGAFETLAIDPIRRVIGEQVHTGTEEPSRVRLLLL